MNLRSELKIKPSENPISLEDPVILIGSCFSENIGTKLASNKFKTRINPFGTLYNPHSIFNLINNTVSKKHEIDDRNIVFNQGVYRYLGFHSSISNPDKMELMEQAKIAFRETCHFLSEAKWLIITLGSSIVYIYNETDCITANCHKLPSKQFRRQIMTIEDILKGFNEMHVSLTGYNRNLSIILTVSPVRHLRDGFGDNQVSKSTLRLACESISRQYPRVSYFPAYEIMMDDLRDYRFYADDLVHPNNLAIEYIWEKFSECYLDQSTQEFINAWGKVLKSIHHRPFHPGTHEYRQFIKQTIDQLLSFKDKVDVEEELKSLNELL